MNRYTHGGNLYKASRESGGAAFLDFSANINPLGLSATVLAALQKSLADVVHYPDPDAAALRGALVSRYGMPVNSLVLGNGAAELFYLLCLVRRPGHVFVCPPAFSEYERSALAAGAEVHFVPLLKENYAVDWAALQAAVTDDSLVFLGHPNNPTGNLLDLTELETFLTQVADRNCQVVVDESFLDFIDLDGRHSCFSWIKRYPHLTSIRSLTKIFAIPGLRLGFGVMAPELAASLERAKDQWNVNVLAQTAGTAALIDTEYLRQTQAAVPRWRQQLLDGLACYPAISVTPSVVNFLLLDMKNTGKDAPWWRQAFYDRRILVRDCSNYVALSPGHIRIAVRTETENSQFLNALQGIMEGLS